ncbi:MAG: sulfite exporter TauE/SafE family protein [Pseudomonadota bacterium]
MEWLTAEIAALAVTAATIGVVHTAVGPDHYLPFVMLSRARQWTARWTAAVTLACGLIHVLGSVLLGLVGVAAGLALRRLEIIESFRGDLAAWSLLAFGLMYLVWGLRKARRGHTHSHWHTHADGTSHEHAHDHADAHAHVHAERKGAGLTPWALFLIFAFGPCEALIPVLMYPAAASNTAGLVLVTVVFAIATLTTMLVLVLAGRWTLARAGHDSRAGAFLDQHAHAFAGAAISICAGLMLIGL